MTDHALHRVIEPSVLYLGTPAFLVASLNPDGTPNLAPASSHFALGRVIVIGLEEGGQSLDNLRRHPQLTVNFPSSGQWQHVERLAGVTGKFPVPEEKRGGYSFEADKFALAGLTAVASQEPQEAVVELLRCDGGEIVDRVRLTDPYDVRWARVQQAAQASTIRP